MANVFVNPGWISVTGGTAVYFTESSLYKDSGEGRTQATCYSTLEEAYGYTSSDDIIYVYNDSFSPLSLLAQSGEYCPQSPSFVINKTLYVRAGTFRLSVVQSHHTGFVISNKNTLVDFGVSNSVIVDADTSFVVSYGANFQLGSTGSSTSVSLQNSGTVSVTTGIGEEAAPSNFYAGNTSITNTGEIEVIGSSFSVASVTNTGNGTFKVEGTSKLEIGTLSGTITLNKENVTLNASNITGGSLSATAYGAIFTGANTLNGVALNASGKTVTVGNNDEVPDSLTVKGTSSLIIGTLNGAIKTDANELTTLNASSITGGSISAQNDLTFTGANALNDITLDASGKTVTVGTAEGDSLTVGGTSTLNIGTLNGEIKTAASTTLQNSSITGGGANGGTITAQGAITVNNSTITSSKFTATTVNGVDFYGENTLDGVTLDTGVWGYVYIDTDGTLTIKGKSTLKTPSLQGSRTIKLDGAEIVDSWIGGHQTNGGTLVVESDKTATFSTTGSNSNDFGRTSIDNSGTINVNGLLSLSTTTGTINNSGTINVNGTFSTGAITNTNGTIALNGGATVSSTISGGSITTSNTGTVTVQDSTISSSAFTATADEVIFSDENTLSGVTFNATAENTTVKANNTLTVSGTSTLNIRSLDGTIKTGSAGTTLNASNITGGGTNGGTITALGNLTFTGTNVLQDVTFNATAEEKTVTVDTSLWVQGTSTLNIGNLNGTIRLNNGATISNSTVYADVSKEGETPTYQGYLRITGSSITFAGANTFLSVDGEKGISLSNDNGASATVKSTSNQKGELKAYFINNNNLGGNLTVGSETDACSLDAIALYNRGAITVQGNKNDQERSKVSASEIKNEDANARMTLNYSELTATTLKNYGHGTTAQAGIAITDSTVSITGSLANGLSTETEATIEFNDSTVTAVSVMNYGKINMTNSKFDAASVVNNNNGFGSFTVKGTSTLDIGSLEGKITIANPGNFETPITLTDSQIVGKVENGNRLGIIDIRDPLTFTGTNTLTNITVDATANYGSVTVGTDEGDSLTVKGTSSLRTASLNGTILTDADALTTLNASSITGGGTNGGTITAQNNLAFTGANTLTNVALATTNYGAVTVGNDDAIDDSLTAGGTLSFNGNLNVASNASLAVGDGAKMTVTGNISNNGSITVTGTGSLSVANIINSNDNSNDNNGTITIEAGSTVKVTGGSSSISGGTLNIVTKDGETSILEDDLYILVNGAIGNDVAITVDGSGSYDPSDIPGYQLVRDAENGLFLTKTGGASDLFVSSDYIGLANGTVTSDGHLVGYNAFSSIEAAVDAGASEIVIEHGTYDDPTAFDGVSSNVQNGDFNHSVSGGCQLTASPASPLTGNITMSVENGSFGKMVNPGDYVLSGSVTRGAENNRSELALTANGGTFENYLVGGMAYASTEMDGFAKLIGDIDLTVKGGTFERYIYGGSIAKTKLVSALTEIHGDISVLVNAGETNISVKQIICGSYNLGKVFGDITLTLSGSGSNLHFVDGGEIWGGNGAEYHDANGTLVTNMEGWVVHSKSNTPTDSVTTRTLSFTGFSGTLDCPKIRAFSDIEFIGNTNVTLSKSTVDLSKVEFWKIAYNADAADDSSLKGNFANNFTGDTLTLDMTALAGDLAANWSWTILENTREGAFAGFGEEGFEVYLKNGDSSILKMSWDPVNKWYSNNDSQYHLALNDMASPTKMVLTLA